MFRGKYNKDTKYPIWKNYLVKMMSQYIEIVSFNPYCCIYKFLDRHLQLPFGLLEVPRFAPLFLDRISCLEIKRRHHSHLWHTKINSPVARRQT